LSKREKYNTPPSQQKKILTAYEALGVAFFDLKLVRYTPARKEKKGCISRGSYDEKMPTMWGMTAR